jgi:beta-glucosidase
MVTAQTATHLEQKLAQMTLREKIGQMSQVEKNSITPAEVTEYAIGSVLSGGGGNPTPNTPRAWRDMVTAYLEAALKTRLAIPLIYGVDAVHGHNNMHGATLFPHNIGLGVAADPDLVERIGRATAREMLACNVHWDFAPCIAVAQDPRWGRTYESYGNDPRLVGELGSAFVRGLQAEGASACIKHFVADGGAEWGTRRVVSWAQFWESNGGAWMIDQADANISEDELRRVHLAPYVEALKENALTVMASFSSWRGAKMHANRYLLTDVLKGELGFKGFVVSDWMGINQLSPDWYTCVVMGVNAGLDMVMIPYDFRAFIDALERAVELGDVPLSRIDDAVRRILWVKDQLGLFQRPFADESLLEAVGCAEHRALAREAARKSLNVVKNDSALPIAPHVRRLHVAGEAADDIGLQCGGWTVEWQGVRGRDVVPGVTLWSALQKAFDGKDTALAYAQDGVFATPDRAEVGIVVLSETPYAEGVGDRADLGLSAQEVALVERVRATCDKLVLLVYSGRVLDVQAVQALCDAVVMAGLPGSEGDGIADALLAQ